MKSLEEYVGEILRDIRERGVEAVMDYSRKFDGYSGPMEVSEEEFREAEERIPEEDRKIIKRTTKRLWDYHERQKPKDELFVKNGSLYGLIYRPIRRIGIYVPGGKPLPSTLMMVAVPAKIAGVKEIAVTIPPKDGKVNPYVLYVAKLLGIAGAEVEIRAGYAPIALIPELLSSLKS